MALLALLVVYLGRLGNIAHRISGAQRLGWPYRIFLCWLFSMILAFLMFFPICIWGLLWVNIIRGAFFR